MKEKTKSLVILILLGISIYLCFWIYREKQISTSAITIPKILPDTIYMPISKYSKAIPYEDEFLPSEVWVYQTSKFSKANGNSLHRDGGPGSRNSQDRINTLSSDTTKQFQDSGPLLYDSISQILLKNNQLELTTKNTLDSTYKIRKFKIDPSKYNYNWVDNKLTYKKRINLQLVPYIKGSYRPFNKLTDLNAGISLETGKFNYNLGFNLFYYPNLSNKVGKDLEISITYKFK